MRRLRSVKIVATLGPASSDYDTIRALFEAGADVFRLNMSHGTHDDIRARHSIIRKVETDLGRPICILADLQGPKLRVGEIENNALPVVPGQTLTFTNEKCVGTAEKIYVSYPNLAGDVKIGNKIFLLSIANKWI